jgi:hypothetical protein
VRALLEWWLLRRCRCPAHDRPRYGPWWRLRDAARTLAFTARHRRLRYYGLCLLAAGALLALSVITSGEASAAITGSVFTLLALGGLLLAIDGLRRLSAAPAAGRTSPAGRTRTARCTR